MTPLIQRRQGLGILTARAIAISVVFALAGCGQPSLLITPVSARAELEETELSRDSFFARDKIVLIDVTGLILNTPAAQFLGEGEQPVSLLLEQFDKARRDPRVKGVLLRINSPGGSVVASELMHDEISHFRRISGKPVIAVMMDVAASGGYYIACACDEIVAQPSTVTGSIGVMMQTVDVTGTMNLIGVKTDAITSGALKDAGSPLRAMKPEERELFQKVVNEMYDRFVAVVDAGRAKLDEQAVRKLADGRVYTAKQALEAGLIDRIATLHESVGLVKERIGSSSVRLVKYHRWHEYRPNYYAAAPDLPSATVNLLNVDLRQWRGGATPQFLYLWAPGM